MMDLLDKYSDSIFMEDPNVDKPTTNQGAVMSSSSSVNTVLLAVLVSLAAGFIG